MDFAIQFIKTLFDLLSVAIIARILLSWFQTSRGGPLHRFVNDITEPIIRVAKKITPRTGMIDLSPLIALIALDIIRAILIRLLLQI